MKRNMIIKDRFKNIIDKARGMNREQLNFWRYTLIFLIVVDLIGVFWFLHLKKLGIALMVVLIIVLALIMFLESKLPEEPKAIIKPNNKTREKEVKKMPIEKETVSEEQEEDNGFNLGLPDSEELNKRMEDAFTFKGW